MAQVYMDVKKELSRKGFVFIPKWNVNQTINELAGNLGSIVKISDYLNHSMISDAQLISPKDKDNALKNQYSGEFGLDAFPLHTDLAHWSQPPNYLMLRCIKGDERVATKILPLDIIKDMLEQHGIRRSVVKSRGRNGCLFPLLFNVNGECFIRWDSYFLEPINENARVIRKLMLTREVWELAIDVYLVNFGDTLILNNHAILHGRSNIPSNFTERKIERIYFN
ncbi:hypothetical protein CF168_03560 [Shewanella bicestrii]|uniref:Uncharacterized protein n=1 Tax=Shewanella bicestrii TaxID=2018305 RepID=A0A220UJD5_9GAMM|nr:hypothetical protein CF168_03560 [Shewanella bicestrii]